MKTIAASALVLCMSVSTAPPAAAQTPVGEALGELGSGCRVGLTFGRCAAYAVAHDSNNTALDSRGAPLPPAAARQPTFRHSEPRGTVPPSPRPPAAPAAVSAAQQQPSSPSSSELEVVFWQSIATSTNPAEFEAYLRQFPNGIFRELAQIRLQALRAAANDSAVSAGTAHALVGAAPGRAGDVFRDCTECPEMVVTAGGRLAMGRYEVTVGEYQAFVSATGGTGNDVWRDHDYFPQTDRHPVTLVTWEDAQAYLSWLSRRTGSRYRLPTEAEWARAALGSQPGCYEDRTGRRGTCPVGSYGSNPTGLSDMLGNVVEWTSDHPPPDPCDPIPSQYRRVAPGGDWTSDAEELRLGAGLQPVATLRNFRIGFRVARILE